MASATIFAPNSPATTACDVCAACVTDPITNKTICFDYQLGDPININNLEYVEAATDMVVKSRGVSFEFQRSYRSRVNYDGPLGANWDFSYNKRLVPHPEDGNIVILYDGTGRGDPYYVVSEGNGLKSPPGYFQKVMKESNGTLTLRNFNGSLSQFYPLDSSPKAGKLATIISRCGDRLTFEYSPADGLLMAVRDSYNRPITLTYNADKRIAKISAFTGQEVSYTYSTEGDLIAVTSPAVTGTPTGNDFPQGKTWRYTYATGFSDPYLNHNLLTVTAPNEVANNGPPRVVNTYNADDRLQSQTWGGTNSSGVAAGGTITYQREVQNTGVDPTNPDLPREVVTVTDRNGNVTVFSFNCNKQLIKKEELTRGIRPGDPQGFVTQYKYTTQGLLQEQIMPQGSRIVYEYDENNGDVFQAGNLLSVTHYPDTTRGGEQPLHKVSYCYEPVFSQVWKATDSRGNTVEYVPDYFEGGLDTPGCDCGHTLGQLVAQWGLDISAIQSQLNQGDLNGDGKYSICGNLIVTRYPQATLRQGSPQALAEGGPMQIIETRVIYNKFGQIEKDRNTRRGSERILLLRRDRSRRRWPRPVDRHQCQGSAPRPHDRRLFARGHCRQCSFQPLPGYEFGGTG